MVKIAPSTDPAKNFENLMDLVKDVQNDAHFLHVDVMDGKFVQNTTFGSDVVAKINANTGMMLDVHLMVKNPNVAEFVEAGANIVTVHYESFKCGFALKRALKKIRKLKALAGISIKPKTRVEDIFKFLPLCDIVLVMSVEPGMSGQKFLEQTYGRVETLKKYISDHKLNVQIEIDGGVNAENANKLVSVGADILVSGNYVYSSKNRVEAIKSLM